ncbi:DNA-directed RNA polymerase II subunit RPB7-like, partial [Lepeophtheirus salmonis]|uniref:DNA-directed RNA polymerase II subunit RPB7-like n=1 Tax=Lepeophtheirus salmonis TaxID=72036 RepID=UPI001AE39E34
MFFLKTLTHSLSILPPTYNETLKTSILGTLHTEVENKCFENIGFVIRVKRILKIKQMGVTELGVATFAVRYTALVLNVTAKSVINIQAMEVNSMGVFGSIGQLVSVFISKMQLKESVTSTNMNYNNNDISNNDSYSTINSYGTDIVRGDCVR